MLAGMATRGTDPFGEGLALFNAGRFFECHEAWERIWKQANGTEKLFYQGLIQAAVAILHAERGNLRGAASIYKKARAALDPLPTVYLQLALGEFRVSLEEFFVSALAGNHLPPRPQIKRAHRSACEAP